MSKKLKINAVDLTSDFRYDDTGSAQSLGYGSSSFLSAWWKFEELAAIIENDTLIYDYSAQNNHGVYRGAVEDITFTSAPGRASGAYMPGNVYVDFPPLGALGVATGNISVSFWLKVSPSTTSNFSSINILKIGNNKVQISIDDEGLLRLQLGIIEGEDVTSFVLKNRVQSTGVNVANNEWQFVSYTYNAKTFKNSFYLNGNLLGTYVEEETYASSDTLQLSVLSPSTTTSGNIYPNFSISDLACWSTELSTEEVQTIHNVYKDMRLGKSGFMGYPAKVLLNELDNSPNSYPTIHRADSDIGFGTDLSRPYDDSKTIVFDSAYANAWIKFYSRPRDASTITLHDPAGSISLLPATAAVWTSLDDLTVSPNDELKTQQMYQVLSYRSSTIKLQDTTNHTLLKSNDYPQMSGLWSGIRNVTDGSENIILEDPSGGSSHHPWIGSDEGGMYCRVTVTSLGKPDPDEGAVDDYFVEYTITDDPYNTLRIDTEVPNIKVEFLDNGSSSTVAEYDANLLTVKLKTTAVQKISDVVNAINLVLENVIEATIGGEGTDQNISLDNTASGGVILPATPEIIGSSYVGTFQVQLFKPNMDGTLPESPVVIASLENLPMNAEEELLNDLALPGTENPMFDGLKISWPNPFNSDGGSDTDLDGVITYSSDVTDTIVSANASWEFRLSPPDKFIWRKANLEDYSGRNAWTNWYPGYDDAGSWKITGQYIGAGNVRREYVLKNLRHSKADDNGEIVFNPYSLGTIDHISGTIPDRFNADVYIRGDISSNIHADPSYSNEYYELYFGFDKQTWHEIGDRNNFKELKDSQKSPYKVGASDTGTYEYSPYTEDYVAGDIKQYAGRWAAPMAYAPFADGHKFSKRELQYVPKDDNGDPLYDSMPDDPHLEQSQFVWPSSNIARAWTSDNNALAPAGLTATNNIPPYMMYQEARDAGLITHEEVSSYIALGNQKYSTVAEHGVGGVALWRKIRYTYNEDVIEKPPTGLASSHESSDGDIYTSLSYSATPVLPSSTPSEIYIGDIRYPDNWAPDPSLSGLPVYQLATDRYDTDKYGETQLYFKVRPGSKVSWGACQIKVAANFAGRFWYFDDIDNDTANGNNIRLSWENYIGHGYGFWTVNVEDSTKETFEFNRGKIVNPANTAVNIRKLRKRDQINDAFAKAVNKSGLQIVAKSDGEKVLLSQTIPGSTGNLEIHATTRARCHISNSKLFKSGSKGEVTGSFSGGDNYLVSYPTLLPAKVHMTDPDGALLYSSESGHVASARMAGMKESPYSLDSNGNKLWTNDSGNVLTTNDITSPWDPETSGVTETVYMEGLGYTRASLSEAQWLAYEGLTEGIHIESPWLNHRIMSPNSQSLDPDRGIIEAGLIATGACVKGVSDTLLNFDSPIVGPDRHFITDPLNPQLLHGDYSTTPFVDNKIDIDIENEFYDEGTSHEIYEGLSSPLKSKTQVIIDLKTVSPTVLGYDVKQRYRGGKVQGVGFRSHKFDFFERVGHKWRIQWPDDRSITLNDDLELTGKNKNYFVFYARGDIDGRSKNPPEEVFKINIKWRGDSSGQLVYKQKVPELSDNRFYRYLRFITAESLGYTGYTNSQGEPVPASEALDGTGGTNEGYTNWSGDDKEKEWVEKYFPNKYEFVHKYTCPDHDPEHGFDINIDLGGPEQGLSPRRKGPYSYFDFGNPHAVVILPQGTVTKIECTPGTEVDYGVNQVYMRVWPKAYSFGANTAVSPNDSKTKLFNNMAYYNFKTMEWEEIGPGITTQPQGPDGHAEFFEDACIGFSRGMELIQTGTQAAALPITNFGFPSHPKFTASDDQLISMDKFIVRPFVLEKFVLEYDAAWAEGSDYSKRTVMYDVTPSGTLERSDEDGNFNNKAAINSFFILNQRDWVGQYDYEANAQSQTRWGKPHYARNITHDSNDNAKNRYMWNGNDYPYKAGKSLKSWYRFNPEEGVTDIDTSPSYGTGPELLYDTWSYVDYPSNQNNPALPVVEESSPWQLPDGVDTSEFKHAVKLEGDNFLTSRMGLFLDSWLNFSSSLETVADTSGLQVRDRLDHISPPTYGWTQGAEWRYIAVEGNYSYDAPGATSPYHPVDSVRWVPFTDRPDGTSYAPGNWDAALVFHNADIKSSGMPAPISGSFARYNVPQVEPMHFTYKFAQAATSRYTYRDIINMGRDVVPGTNSTFTNPDFGPAESEELFKVPSGFGDGTVDDVMTKEAIIHYVSSSYWYVTITDTLVPSGAIPSTWSDALSIGWVNNDMYAAGEAGYTPGAGEPTDFGELSFPYGHQDSSNSNPVSEWSTAEGGIGPGLNENGQFDYDTHANMDVYITGSGGSGASAPPYDFPTAAEAIGSPDFYGLGKYIPCMGSIDPDTEVNPRYLKDDKSSLIYTVLPELNEPPDTWRMRTSAMGKNAFSGYGSEALRLQISKTHRIDIDDESPSAVFQDRFEPDPRWTDIAIHEPDYTKQGVWQSYATFIDPKKYFGADYSGSYYLRFYQEGATYPDSWAITDMYTKTSFTFSFWFKVKAISRGWSNIFTIADEFGAPNKIWIAFRKDQLRMVVDTGENRIKTIAKVPKNLGVEKGSWHHMAFSFDQASMACRFYLDGELLITYKIPQKTNSQGELLWQSGITEVLATEIDNPYDGTQTRSIAGQQINLTEEEYMTGLGYPPALPWEFQPTDYVVFGADVDKLTWKLAVAMESSTGASQWLADDQSSAAEGTYILNTDPSSAVLHSDLYTGVIGIDAEGESYGPGVQGWQGVKFDNYFKGSISNISVFKNALNGLSIKGLYHMHKGGYYKKGLESDVSLKGNLPFRFDVPLSKDFIIRTPAKTEPGRYEFENAGGGLTEYNISNKLLARYLANPNEFNKIESKDHSDTSIRNNLTGIIVGDINYADDGPWIPPIEPADIFVPDGLKFSVDFEDNKNDNKKNIDAHIKLPRAKEFFTPQTITQVTKGTVTRAINLTSFLLGRSTRKTIKRDKYNSVTKKWIRSDSYTPETFDGYPAFSVFSWIKIPDEQTVTDPVIFAINDKHGRNKLMFFIDTADSTGAGDSGDRLSLRIESDRIDDTYFTDIPDDYSDGTTDLTDDITQSEGDSVPDPGSYAATIDLTRAGRYTNHFTLSTAKFANPEIANDENNIKTLRDGKWHFVGFTYQPGNSTHLDGDGNPLYNGAESSWQKEYARQIYEPQYVDLTIGDSVVRLIAGTDYLTANQKQIKVTFQAATSSSQLETTATVTSDGPDLDLINVYYNNGTNEISEPDGGPVLPADSIHDLISRINGDTNAVKYAWNPEEASSKIEAILLVDGGDAFDVISGFDDTNMPFADSHRMQSATRRGLGNYKIYIDGEAQELFKQSQISVRGPLNDLWLYDFDYGLEPRDPSSTAFNRKGNAWDNTSQFRDAVESFIFNFTDGLDGAADADGVNIEFGDYEQHQYMKRSQGDDVSYSNMHKSLRFDELDRLSIGQEYDIKRYKSRRTGKTFRYRSRSQIFNGQMADITMWSESLDTTEIKTLYNTRFGSSEVTKWFNRFTATSRDLVTFGQWSIYAGVTQSSVDVNDLLEGGLSREVTTLASMPSDSYIDDGTLQDHDGDPSSEMIVSGSYVMEGIVKRPVRHEHGLAYKIGTKGGPYGYRSLYKTQHSGVRSGLLKDISSSRSIFNSVPGTDATDPAEDFGREVRGRDSTPLRIFEEGKEESPYILYPTDKLVFGWQAAQPYDFKRVSDAGTGPHLSIAPNASDDLPANMKITLYGSYLSDGKEVHDPLNQKLTSNNLHEALQSDAPVHDVFHLDGAGYLAGTHRDDIVSGSIFIKQRDDEARANDIIRRKVASISAGNQGITGSMLHGVRMVDSKERFYDTVVPAPADYHEFNGNGVLEWRHPLFMNNRLQRSLVFGEPRPSDQKVIVPEKTIIRCQGDGWYEPLPQGVIKLSFSRLWTADYYPQGQSISVKDLAVSERAPRNDAPDDTVNAGTDGSYLTTLSPKANNIYWYIDEVQDDKWAWGYGYISTAIDSTAANTGLWYNPAEASVDAISSQAHCYNYVPWAAAPNYMFSSGGENLADGTVQTRLAYFSIYDANGEHWVVWLDWGNVDPPSVSNNIIRVDMSGWLTGENGWELGNPQDYASDGTPINFLEMVSQEDFLQEEINASYTAINAVHDWAQTSGFIAKTAPVTNPATLDGDGIAAGAADFVPSGACHMPAATFAQKVGVALRNIPGFEVLGRTYMMGVPAFMNFTEDENNTICSIYIRTASGGLTAANLDNSQDPVTGGGIPGVHYAKPEIDSNYLYRSYYKYISRDGGNPIVQCYYSSEDLKYDGNLVSADWGVSRSIKDYVNITEGDGHTKSFTDDDVDWRGIASSLGFRGRDDQGIKDYIDRIRPNDPTQFLRQVEVNEEKGGFSRVADYTLDGAWFQIHDAKDVAYNVWYVLDDGDSSSPPSPTTDGTLIIIDTVPRGASAQTVAKQTFEVISGSDDLRPNFNVYYNEGDEFFTIENVQDGSAKDMDSTIMGLPSTTGFYLTDEEGEEYDNDFSFLTFQWGGSLGSFSLNRVSIDTETYAEGRTGEDPEVFWQGDPIQEGVDPYHANTNALIDSYWLGSFPFEPRYSSLRRRRWLKDDKSWTITTWDEDTGEFDETSRTTTGFTTAIITGSNIPTQLTDPSMDDGEETYQVLTVISDGTPNVRNSDFRASGKTRNNFFKFYFGSGNTWQKNPEIQTEYIDSDGYSWPSAVPKIRGWKYGLKSAVPENSSAVFRHDRYGQMRDMLEQRNDTRFYKQLTRGKYAGFSYVTRPAVFVRFVDQNGRLTQPNRTWSQNLSKFCTSSLPYFDDSVPRNREYPLNEDELNTTIIALGE